MGIDESAFGALWRAARRLLAAAPKGPGAAATHAEPELRRLALLASLLAGQTLRVAVGPGAGGVLGDLIVLPAVIEFTTDPDLNADALVVAVVWAVSAHALGVGIDADLDPLATWVATALAAPHVRQRVVTDFVGVAPRLERLERVALQAAGVPANAQAAALLQRLTGGDPAAMPIEPHAPTPAAITAHARTIAALLRREDRRVAAPPPIPWVGLLRRVASPAAVAADGASTDDLPTGARPEAARPNRVHEQTETVAEMENRLEDNPVTHSFEKVHTLDDYLGGHKRMDGSDELDAHGEALAELDLGRVIRSRVQTRSLYQVDVLLAQSVADTARDTAPAEGILYPEWDESRRTYRPGWCRVASRPATPATPEATAAWTAEVGARTAVTERRLRTEFERVQLARRPRRRQRAGDEVDLDAVVEHLAELRAGHAGSDRLYVQPRRHRPDVAVVLLVDISLSTDAWVSNRRVLDVARESVLVLSRAVEGILDDVAVGAFCSQTRRDCRFFVVKELHEPWSHGVARLAALEPTGYTRIGPALRHASAALAAHRARRRVVVVLSDGRPTDYDRYEGRYGVSDVRQAVREARQAGVEVFGLGIDPRAADAQVAMFGVSNSEVLPSVAALPDALSRFFLHLA